MGAQSQYVRPADEARIITSVDLPFDIRSLGSQGLLKVEQGSGRLVVRTYRGEVTTLTVTEGEEIPLLVSEVLDEHEGDTTQVTRIRIYLHRR